MAKKIIFSFDDGRLDTFEIAVPVMGKYGLTATINIATDFIINPGKYDCFKSACNKAMRIEQVQELYEKGYEIASHGNQHDNRIKSIRESIIILNSWGIEKVWGFASPESIIDENNISSIDSLIKDKTLMYIRSGLQIRKQSISYIFLYIVQKLIRSKWLFYYLNKKQIISKDIYPILEYGISISKDTTVRQILYFIDRMPEEATAIFIFHSILERDAPGEKQDKWYWSVNRFEELCRELASDKNCHVINNADIFVQNARIVN